jgi:hypothetical protein
MSPSPRNSAKLLTSVNLHQHSQLLANDRCGAKVCVTTTQGNVGAIPNRRANERLRDPEAAVPGGWSELHLFAIQFHTGELLRVDLLWVLGVFIRCSTVQVLCTPYMPSSRHRERFRIYHDNLEYSMYSTCTREQCQ